MKSYRSFSEFISQIKAAMLSPLPGAAAQELMAPAHRLSSAHYFSTIKEYKKGSVLILIYEHQQKPHLVLTLRQAYQGVHSAQISLPGGKIEAGDANQVAAALRETQEEIGIAKHQIEVLGELTQLYIPPSNFLVYPVLACAKEDLHFVKDPIEVAEIIHVPIDLLLSTAQRRLKTMDLSRGAEVHDLKSVQVPYFDLLGQHVWGATAMILSEFAALIQSQGSRNN